MNGKKLIVSVAVAGTLLALSLRAASGESLAVVDLTPQLENAHLNVDGLRAVEVGTIVILRGRTTDAAAAQQAGAWLQNLGYNRVANLIQIVPPADDAAIARTAERTLAMHRALDGCTFRVDSEHGVVSVAGQVGSELQKDMVLGLLRNIDGVRAVKSDLRQR